MSSNLIGRYLTLDLNQPIKWAISDLTKGVAMIFFWGGPDFKPQIDDT
jgi:hypothetical protein